MSKILNVEQAIKIAQDSKKKGLSIVLAGGVFDILHKGHIFFLESAKKHADLLFVLLESDENTRAKKGHDRPINSQKKRSIVLSAVSFVDFLIVLKGVTKDKDYDKLLVQIKPAVIAITKGDGKIKDRKKQAEMIGANLILIDKKPVSTTGLISKIRNGKSEFIR